MKTTINGQTYDTTKSEEICTDASPDGDDILYRTKDGRFFVVAMSTFVDGVKLRPDQETMYLEQNYESDEQRRAHIRCYRRIVPLSDREALVWCVKTQMPDCFRGYLLEAI